MNINPANGICDLAHYIPSPHWDDRPHNATIDMVVVHGISLPPGQFGNGMIEQFFCGTLDSSLHPYFSTIRSLRVSAHLLIDRKGKLTQFVPFIKRAWHAGESSFYERPQCNDFSIGIELEGTDDMPYEAIQYEQLARVIHSLFQVYPMITRDRVVGHSDIAPGRKTDPGPFFDWACLDRLLVDTNETIKGI